MALLALGDGGSAVRIDESASGRRALVRRVELAPGASLPMHEHGMRILVALTAVRSRETLPDGTIQDAELAARDFKVSGPKRHAVANLAATPLVVVEIEPRAVARPAPDPGGDVLAEDPAHFTLLHRGEGFRVLRFRLGPRASSLLHSHGEGVAVRLDAMHSRTTEADGTTREERSPAGEAVYRPPVRHAVENLSVLTYEAVIVEFTARP